MTENNSSASSPESLDSLSYEEAREQLMGVVSRLEAGGASLEESLALWERGEALAKRCEDWLEGARKRLATARDASNDAGAATQ
ncbi:exodeoxyribonuclease VII small subunit [Paenarthrobacter sp. YAF11_1]|uniref:exodeoxyribonuclease VII small subunit n=1 Tax=Micrococcaceae TaxID=1268 RepID=UPI0028834C5B|nr:MULTISPECIES: exodeoxyribonuclease VII small subunit [unclassified Arthrobacter]